MRETCLECTVKHVGAALVDFSEALHGYQDHVVLGIGELEHGVQETEARMPALSEHIRSARKQLTSLYPEYLSDTEAGADLIDDIVEIEAELRRRVWAEMLAQYAAAPKKKVDITPSENV